MVNGVDNVDHMDYVHDIGVSIVMTGSSPVIMGMIIGIDSHGGSILIMVNDE